MQHHSEIRTMLSLRIILFPLARQRNDREEEAPSAQHHAVGAGQQNVAVQVEQKPALVSSAVSSTVVAVRDPSIRPKYVCEVCNKGFKSGYNLKRHANDYHGENSSIIAAKGYLVFRFVVVVVIILSLYIFEGMDDWINLFLRCLSHSIYQNVPAEHACLLLVIFPHLQLRTSAHFVPSRSCLLTTSSVIRKIFTATISLLITVKSAEKTSRLIVLIPI